MPPSIYNSLGLAGPAGADGAAGGTVPYLFEALTASADPLTGRLRFNNATLASTTAIYLDDHENTINGLNFKDNFTNSTSAADAPLTNNQRTLVNGAVISSNQLDLTSVAGISGGTVNGAQYGPAGNATGIVTVTDQGRLRLKWTTGTMSSGFTDLFSALQGPAGAPSNMINVNVGIDPTHPGDVNYNDVELLLLGNDNTGSIYAAVYFQYDFAPNTTYDIDLRWNTSTLTFACYINGVSIPVDGASSNSGAFSIVPAGIDTLVVGGYFNAQPNTGQIDYIELWDTQESIRDFLLTWDDSGSTVKGNLIVSQKADPTKSNIFEITGLTPHDRYIELAVTHLEEIGGTNVFSDGDELTVGFARAGDVGSAGSPATTGMQAGEVTLADFPTGGSIGLAAATVDIAGNINIPQTTAGQTLLFPAPTDTSSAHCFTVSNTGSATFQTATSVVCPVGGFLLCIWTGSTYIFSASQSAGASGTAMMDGLVTLGDFPGGGSIGPAAGNVDIAGTILINQTTPGQTLGFPAPSNAADAHYFILGNIGSAEFITATGARIPPGGFIEVTWTGSTYLFGGDALTANTLVLASSIKAAGCTAANSQSIGVGPAVQANGVACAAFNYNNVVNGNYGMSFGTGNTQAGDAGLAAGANCVTNGSTSFAMGSKAQTGSGKTGAFCFTDGQNFTTTCEANDQMKLRFQNGIKQCMGAGADDVDGPNLATMWGKVDTTDATPTTAFTLSTQTDTVYFIQFRVIGKRTGGSAGSAGDSSVYFGAVKVKNVGGTVSVAGFATNFSQEDNAATAFTNTISGTDVLFQVTGDTNNNYTWFVSAQLSSN